MATTNKNKKYRRDKRRIQNFRIEMKIISTIRHSKLAWDTDDIDHWKVEEFKPDPEAPPFLEESSFATLFPKYREAYLREVWPLVTNTLKSHV
jgi:hypothetical protein